MASFASDDPFDFDDFSDGAEFCYDPFDCDDWDDGGELCVSGFAFPDGDDDGGELCVSGIAFPDGDDDGGELCVSGIAFPNGDGHFLAEDHASQASLEEPDLETLGCDVNASHDDGGDVDAGHDDGCDVDAGHDDGWGVDAGHDDGWDADAGHDDGWDADAVHNDGWDADAVHDDGWGADAVHDYSSGVAAVHDDGSDVDAGHDVGWDVAAVHNDGSDVDAGHGVGWEVAAVHNDGWVVAPGHNGMNEETEVDLQLPAFRMLVEDSDLDDGGNFIDGLVLRVRDASVHSRQLPASRVAVQALPEFAASEEEAPSGCAVCKDDIAAGQLVVGLPCKHFFHGDCIRPWLAIRNTCPVCRYELPTGYADYDRQRSIAAGASPEQHGATVQSRTVVAEDATATVCAEENRLEQSAS